MDICTFKPAYGLYVGHMGCMLGIRSFSTFLLTVWHSHYDHSCVSFYMDMFHISGLCIKEWNCQAKTATLLTL